MQCARLSRSGRVSLALWALVLVLGVLVVKEALADCASPLCPPFATYPDCSAPGCVGPYYWLMTQFPCCCTSGQTGCCQYGCLAIRCTTEGPNCPRGSSGTNGEHTVGPCQFTGECGQPG